jgi:glyoxylase I family protein
VVDLPEITGISHIDFTVTDAERSAEWWQQVLGCKLVNVGDGPTYKVRNVIHPALGGIGFMQHSEPASDSFDERAVGLDHFAIRVRDRAALEAWARHLDESGVGHSGIKEEVGGPVITFRDPDNIQLELQAVDLSLMRPGVNASLKSTAP